MTDPRPAVTVRVTYRGCVHHLFACQDGRAVLYHAWRRVQRYAGPGVSRPEVSSYAPLGPDGPVVGRVEAFVSAVATGSGGSLEEALAAALASGLIPSYANPHELGVEVVEERAGDGKAEKAGPGLGVTEPTHGHVRSPGHPEAPDAKRGMPQPGGDGKAEGPKEADDGRYVDMNFDVRTREPAPDITGLKRGGRPLTADGKAGAEVPPRTLPRFPAEVGLEQAVSVGIAWQDGSVSRGTLFPVDGRQEGGPAARTPPRTVPRFPADGAAEVRIAWPDGGVSEATILPGHGHAAAVRAARGEPE